MQITKLSELCYIKLTDEEAARFSREVENIVAWLTELHEVDTSSVTPMRSPHSNMSLHLRSDEPEETQGSDRITANAPVRQHDSKPHVDDGFMFVVPPVIE